MARKSPGTGLTVPGLCRRVVFIEEHRVKGKIMATQYGVFYPATGEEQWFDNSSTLPVSVQRWAQFFGGEVIEREAI